MVTAMLAAPLYVLDAQACDDHVGACEIEDWRAVLMLPI